MSFVAILFVTLLGALMVGAAAAIVTDLSKAGAQTIDRWRARRASRRGWDWPAFEQDLARFLRERSGQPPATHRRR